MVTPTIFSFVSFFSKIPLDPRYRGSKNNNNKRTQRAQTPPRPLHCRPCSISAKVAAVSLILYRIKCASDTTVKESVVKTGRRSSSGSGSTPEINDF